MARNYHNKQRSLHETTGALETDIELAKYIQDKMDNFKSFETDFNGVIRKGRYGGCAENVYQLTSGSALTNSDNESYYPDLLYTNRASKDWYESGEPKYTFGTGMPNSEANRAAAEKFVKMLWRGTTKVGFGVKGKWVVAWYCESGGATGPPSNFMANVGLHCVKNNINKCYNKLGADQHNALRV